MAQRSINSADYQELSVAVTVMQKQFPANSVISLHVHRRDQLIFADSGTMRVRTDSHSWILPTAAKSRSTMGRAAVMK